MITATASSTSTEASRFAANNAANAGSKPGSRVERVIGMPSGQLSGGGAGARHPASFGGGAKTLEPLPDFFRPGFQSRPVYNQPSADIGDMLDLDQPVGFQGR